MIKNDPVISALMHDDIINKIATNRNISLSEARQEFSKLNFGDYYNLITEDGVTITPPSGQTISPAAPQKSPAATKSSQPIKSIWPGVGAPVEVGMSVGLKSPNGLPVPGQVSQVDLSANGVKVKNPTTGKDEWMNTDSLEPFMAKQGSDQAPVTETYKNSYTVGDYVDTPLGTGIIVNVSPDVSDTGEVRVKLDDPSRAGEDGRYKDTFVFTTTMLTHTADDGLSRLRELAGIKENCSAGATGAGAIAIAPAAMGGIKRRQSADEALKTEYTPSEPAKTIIGDTKPGQASGKLSATLAANGMKTASRINNGKKK